MAIAVAGFVTHSLNVPIGVFVAIVSGCSADSQDSCQELHGQLEPGIVVSSDAAECAAILEFVKSPIVSESPWPTLPEWLAVVPAQRAHVMLDLIFALPLGEWIPDTFSRVPGEVPCGQGIQVTGEMWDGTALNQAGLERPERFFASYSLTLLGQDARGGTTVIIQAEQDFNCDGVIAVSEIEGVFKRGNHALSGGWTLIRSSFAQIHL